MSKTVDIKELATLIRLNADMRLWPAADALEAMAGEVERLKSEAAELRDGIEDMQRQRIDHKAERDRLKEALLDIKHFGAGFAQDRARKALGGDAS